MCAHRQTWLFSFTSAGLAYTLLSLVFKDGESHVPEAIYAHPEDCLPKTKTDDADVEKARPVDEGDASSEKDKEATSVGVHGVAVL